MAVPYEALAKYGAVAQMVEQLLSRRRAGVRVPSGSFYGPLDYRLDRQPFTLEEVGSIPLGAANP
jgi:hypothetical protein